MTCQCGNDKHPAKYHALSCPVLQAHRAELRAQRETVQRVAADLKACRPNPYTADKDTYYAWVDAAHGMMREFKASVPRFNMSRFCRDCGLDG